MRAGRWLGGVRFTLGALQQILGRKAHQLRLAYLSASESASDTARVSNSTPMKAGTHVACLIPPV